MFLVVMIVACMMCKVVGMGGSWEVDDLRYLADRRRLLGEKLERDPGVEADMDVYMATGMRDVIGWFEEQALLVLRVLSAYQLERFGSPSSAVGADQDAPARSCGQMQVIV